jgi:hypothetical protein
LPIAEAMALELPVIVTNYSGDKRFIYNCRDDELYHLAGITAYATDENAYLIPVLPGVDKESFGIPDGSALIEHLRSAATQLFFIVIKSFAHRQVIVDGGYKGNGVARQKGKKARETMQVCGSWLAFVNSTLLLFRSDFLLNTRSP